MNVTILTRVVKMMDLEHRATGSPGPKKYSKILIDNYPMFASFLAARACSPPLISSWVGMTGMAQLDGK
jgi:hypothetical protein